MKSAGIHKDKKGYILVPLSTTVAGFSISTDPEIRIFENEDESLLVGALKQTLQASKENIANPDFNNITEEQKFQAKEKLKKLDIKSFGALNKKPSLYCSVQLVDDQIVFKPNVYAITGKGFVGRPVEFDVSISYNAPDLEIFKAFKLALSRC